ncbi:MAG: hypothetical protein C4321_02770, partial [Chloroflexota bacterium]
RDVERVGIVDHEDQRAVGGAPEQPVAQRTDRGHEAVRVAVVEMRERAERYRRTGMRRGHRFDRAVRVQRTSDVVDETGLADTDGSDDHGAAPRGDVPQQQFALCRSADQRPLVVHHRGAYLRSEFRTPT